ncbi:MAG TPA: NAD(P)H-dependent oxidoreductase [Microbacteriaceae bacterium]|nr:NAD(P)H-dependent oxidoreductase [Microbacteriaceae bacterium]
MTVRVVAVSGTLHAPSKTDVVVRAAVDSAREQLGSAREQASAAASGGLEAHTIGVLALREELARSLPGGPTPAVQEALDFVRQADVLVVATPVYKGSYTGLLKLFIDFLGRGDIADVPIVLAAIGGSQEHSLVIEHELRPLFGFFSAAPVAEPLYLQPADFAGEGVTSAAALRIARAVGQALAAATRRAA